MASASYWSRRFVRNLGIAAVALVVYLVAVNASHSTQTMFRLSMGTGYASVALIAWAMLIGPWRVWRGRSAPVSTDLRRDVGIWGAALGVAHVVAGLQVHMAGAFWKYFIFPDGEHLVPLRYDLFGFANWTGLAATLVLLLLLAISNDASLRALGSRRWKSWQRWTYWAAVLVVAHGLAYLWIEEGNHGWVYAFAAITVVVLAMQLLGRQRVLRRSVSFRAEGQRPEVEERRRSYR
jgi:sulfoxide reductase heme-binding subunit YedZ